MIKSKFDSGNWSPVNGLPGQDDMIHYLEYLLKTNPTKVFTRQELMDSVKTEFGIPETAATAECPNCQTQSFYTRFTYLITDAVQGKRKAVKPFMKRLSLNEYQYLSDEEITLKYEQGRCLAIMVHARKIGFKKEDALEMFKLDHPKNILSDAAETAYA